MCGHVLADLSEAGYGVSISSEYKYGYAVEGNVMRLSLLRSATAPDPEQDRGKHQFKFAIMPHPGRLLESGTYKRALQFVNDVSVRIVPAESSLQKIATPFQISGSDSVLLDAVKRGEGEDRSVILRMYESLGGRSRAELKM